MILDLIKDFSVVLEAMPTEHPRQRILKLLDEAIRRDVHFIDRHPTTFFQCMWNTCWWYDSRAAANHYPEPADGWETERPPWDKPGVKLHALLELWRVKRQVATPWLRSAQPPYLMLSSPQGLVLEDNGSVRDAVYSPNGKTIVTLGAGLTVWDAQSGLALHRVAETHARLAVSPDGRQIATGSSEGETNIWDAETLECQQTLTGHELGVWSICYSPDGKKLASGAIGGKACIWEVTTGERLQTILADESELSCVSSLCFSHCGNYLVTGSFDEQVRQWDIRSGQEVLEYRGHDNSVLSIDCSPDGLLLLSGSSDRTVRLWSFDTAEELIAIPISGWCKAVAFSPDGSQIAVSDNHVLHIIDLNTGNRDDLEGHENSIESISWSPCGKRVVTTDGGGKVRIWQPDARVKTYTRPTVHISSNFAHSSKTQAVAYGTSDGEIHIWNVLQERKVARFDYSPSIALPIVCRQLHNIIRCLAFSPDGALLVAGTENGVVCLWDVVRNCLLVEMGGHFDEVASVSISDDGSLIASGGGCRYGRDSSVRVWSAKSGAELLMFWGHTRQVKSVKFSEDNRYVVSGSLDKTVRLWDLRTKTESAILEPHPNAVVQVAISSDNQLIASATEGRTVHVWDLGLGTELAVLSDQECEGLCFSPDGELLVIEGPSPIFWNTQTGERREANPPTSIPFPTAILRQQGGSNSESVCEDSSSGMPITWWTERISSSTKSSVDQESKWAGMLKSFGFYFLSLEER